MTESSGLREAAEKGDIAAVSRPVDAGAYPNAADDSGLAPLYAAAAENEDPAVLAAPIGAGADTQALDGSGKTSFECMTENEKLKKSDMYSDLTTLDSDKLERTFMQDPILPDRPGIRGRSSDPFRGASIRRSVFPPCEPDPAGSLRIWRRGDFAGRGTDT